MRSSTPFWKRIHPAPGCHRLSSGSPQLSRRQPSPDYRAGTFILESSISRTMKKKKILLLHMTLSQAFCYSGTDELKQWPFSWQNTIYWEDCIPRWITKSPPSCRTCKPRCVVLPLDSLQVVPVPTRPSKCHVRVWIYSMLKGLLWN